MSSRLLWLAPQGLDCFCDTWAGQVDLHDACRHTQGTASRLLLRQGSVCKVQLVSELNGHRHEASAHSKPSALHSAVGRMQEVQQQPNASALSNQIQDT
jgi:hypothetical protein